MTIEDAMTIEDLRAIVATADSRYTAGDLDGAIAILQPLADQGVAYFRPYYNLGFLHWLRADYAQAAPHLAKSAVLVPKFADGRYLLGKCLTVLGRSAEGLAELDVYAALDGADTAAPLWRARALHGLGRHDEAYAVVLDRCAALGWPTPIEDGLAFSQEPWFLSHVPRWRMVLAPVLGRITRALEIGSMEGMSAVWIAEHLLAPGGRLAINDIEFRPRLTANLARSRFGARVDLHLGDSAVILPDLPDATYDFIYVDGDHSASGVFRDCVNAMALAAPGAFVILDDYGKANEATRAGIDLFLTVFGRSFDSVERGYQITLRRRGDPAQITPEDCARLAQSVEPASQAVLRAAAAGAADLLRAVRQGALRLAVQEPGKLWAAS